MRNIPALKTKSTLFCTAIIGVTLALPAVRPVYGDTPPENGIVSLKYLNYRDWQTGDTPLTAGMSRERIGVQALSLMSMVPVAGEWSLSVSLLDDTVTGASPAYHSAGFPSAVSGASALDHRHEGDVELTRYFSRGSVTGGLSYSKENDYISRSISLQGSWSTEDRNTTCTIGASVNDDSIDLSGDNVIASKKQKDPEKKMVYAGLFGLTKVLAKTDIMQFNFGYSIGNGYYTDPFKDPDIRPRGRNSATFMTRWNHHFDSTDGTMHLSYRYYQDTWGVRAHTLGAEYVQPLPKGWALTPQVRFYSQSEADFYIATGTDPSKPVPPPAGAVYYSEDQRLSAFGAVALGVKLSKQLSAHWLVDVKYERYEQRVEWSLTGKGDPGVASFNARDVQIGVSRTF
jgi:hypothetical protein